ncbi:MAG: hypothetical protein COT74_04050 [Bdellovibrionales bacterium CG10_big_fil_rev_8_21_14_0_10_45_34]|nr:MAG: hypothetical protein COT74_04050 [Bdellovibrionales bacterium CG10_big_fil_rev_8_21_14_0_10_45_34]
MIEAWVYIGSLILISGLIYFVPSQMFKTLFLFNFFTVIAIMALRFSQNGQMTIAALSVPVLILGVCFVVIQSSWRGRQLENSDYEEHPEGLK